VPLVLGVGRVPRTALRTKRDDRDVHLSAAEVGFPDLVNTSTYPPVSARPLAQTNLLAVSDGTRTRDRLDHNHAWVAAESTETDSCADQAALRGPDGTPGVAQSGPTCSRPPASAPNSVGARARPDRVHPSPGAPLGSTIL